MTHAGDLQLLSGTLLLASMLLVLGLVGVVARRSRESTWISFGVLILAVIVAVAGLSSFHADGAGRLLWLVMLTPVLIAIVVVVAASASRKPRRPAPLLNQRDIASSATANDHSGGSDA